MCVLKVLLKIFKIPGFIERTLLQCSIKITCRLLISLIFTGRGGDHQCFSRVFQGAHGFTHCMHESRLPLRGFHNWHQGQYQGVCMYFIMIIILFWLGFFYFNLQIKIHIIHGSFRWKKWINENGKNIFLSDSIPDVVPRESWRSVGHLFIPAAQNFA